MSLLTYGDFESAFGFDGWSWVDATPVDTEVFAGNYCAALDTFGPIFGGTRGNIISDSVLFPLNVAPGRYIRVAAFVRKSSGAVPGSAQISLDYDPGDGNFQFRVSDHIAQSAWTRWDCGTLLVKGPASPIFAFRMTNTSTAGATVTIDNINVSTVPVMYPKGPHRFQESYTDDITGLPVIRSEAIRDLDTLIRHVDDEGAPDPDYLRRMWPPVKELRDDEP